MKSCKEVMADLDRIIDGEVGAMERLSFSLHLAMCGPCETYFRQYRAVRDSVGKLAAEELPEDFAEVMGRVLANVFDKP